jgi:ferredoxin-NADP reductase
MSEKQHQQNTIKGNIPARPQKLQLKLLEKKPHTGTDVVSFKFARKSVADNNQNENQNIYLNYKAGQYAIVDLGTKEDPEGPLRSFTMASSPTEEDFILISTRIRDTPFKRKLASLDIGTPVKITAPLGKFVLHEDYSKTAVFLSGGIGVTPFRSLIKYATDTQLPMKIIMFDSNRNQDNIVFKSEFDEWANKNKNLKIIYTLDAGDNSWKGEHGYINQAMVTKYLGTNELVDSIFYICGPPGMLKAMKKLLQDDLHATKERIKIEEFTGY